MGKQGFRLPTKKVSSLARLAKQIVIQDKFNIPRQTRSQFTLTVLNMLKASQDYVLKRKKKKQEKRQDNSLVLRSNESSDFYSANSNFTAQNAELTEELRK